MEQHYVSLRSAVEKRVGRKMQTPRDFEYLAVRIFEAQKTCISAMSLKRFWGYLGEKNVRVPRLYTLNILASFAGYTDWEAFCCTSSANTVVQSEFVMSESIYSSSLRPETKIRLMWHPDRMVHIMYQGHEQFKVLESLNSKLSVGDTFCCGQFIDGEPLYLHRLVHDGGMPVNYVCGKEDGVRFAVLYEEP